MISNLLFRILTWWDSVVINAMDVEDDERE